MLVSKPDTIVPHLWTNTHWFSIAHAQQTRTNPGKKALLERSAANRREDGKGYVCVTYSF